MGTSGENIRLQLSINGRVKAVAGVSGLGVVSFDLSWCRRAVDRAPTPEQLAAAGFTLDEWLARPIGYGLGALDTSQSQSIEWAEGELEIGDELTIRVLPPGEVDEPVSQRPVPGLPRTPKQRSTSAADQSGPNDV